jgi:uncharacterized protein involved in exopolysaccharide biosynthesis
MQSMKNSHDHQDDEIDLSEFIFVIKDKRRQIALMSSVITVVFVLLALWLPNVYRSEVLLVVEEEGGGALASLASQYGGLASLAGISLTEGVTSEKTIAIEILQSRKFITDFIDKHNALADLMAISSYDRRNNEIDYDKKLYDSVNQVWTRKARFPYQSQPSLQEAYEEFIEHYSVVEDRESGFIRISFDHLSPFISKEWVELIVVDINQLMMDRAIAEAQESIDFLNEQLEDVNIVPLQEVFYSLIEEQTKTIMLASSRQEYLFQTVDPAVVMEEHVFPNRALISVIGGLIGLSVGVCVAFFRFKFYGVKT